MCENTHVMMLKSEQIITSTIKSLSGVGFEPTRRKKLMQKKMTHKFSERRVSVYRNNAMHLFPI